MFKTLQLTPSKKQVESIASNILLMMIRDINILEVLEVDVKLSGLENVSEDRLTEIITELANLNAEQMLKLIDNQSDSLGVDE